LRHRATAHHSTHRFKASTIHTVWWRKVMAAYRRVDDLSHKSYGLTACIPGSALGPTLGNEYGKPLPLLSVHHIMNRRWFKPATKSILITLIHKNRQLLGDCPPAPYRGFARGPHWGTSVSQTFYRGLTARRYDSAVQERWLIRRAAYWTPASKTSLYAPDSIHRVNPVNCCRNDGYDSTTIKIADAVIRNYGRSV